MGVQAWPVPANWPYAIASGSALASSTTLTDISPGAATTAAFSLPANTFYPGMRIRVVARGVYGTTGAPTLLLGVYYGGVAGTAIVTTGAITTASGVAANTSWELEVDINCRTNGTAGTVWGQGRAFNIAATAGVASMLPATGATTATIDTTAAKLLTLGAQWGTNSASNTITCTQFFVDVYG